MTSTRPPRAAETPGPGTLTIREIVLGKDPPRPGGAWRLWAQAVAIALALHSALWLWSVRKPPSLESWSAEVAARIHGLLEFRHVMEIAQPPAVPAEPQAANAPTPKRARSVGQGAMSKTAMKPGPPAAAQAGRLAASTKVVDLTAAAPIAEGHAETYAGGATAAGGKSSAPVYDTNPNPSAEARPGGPDVGRKQIALVDSAWRCPWPEAAQNAPALGNEQVVLLRVTVAADGRFESGSLVSVPRASTAGGDLGFGQAALKCAAAARYTPATDDAGRPIKAVSPPIRVRFVR